MLHQTLKTAFHLISKHLEVHQNYSVMHGIVLGNVVKHSLLCLK